MIKQTEKTKTITALFVILYGILIFATRLFMLMKSEYPTGLDGFFYALQAKSLVVNGALENPDHEIGYYLCGLFSWLFRDAFLGCKIQAALSSALISVLIFILLKIISKEKRQIPVTGMIISSISAGITVFNINFINNQTGLVFFLSYCCALTFTLKYAGLYGKIKKTLLYILCGMLLVLCGLSHLVSAAYAFVFSAVLILKRFRPKLQLILISVFAAAAIVLFFNQLPRFKSVFAIGPVLPCFSPVLMTLAGKAVCIEMSVLFVFTWVTGGWYFIEILNRVQNDRKIFNPVQNDGDLALLLFIPVLFFPFWKLDEMDMGYRMLLNGVAVCIPLNLYFISKIISIKNIERSNDSKKTNRKTIIIVATVLTLTASVSGLFFTHKYYNPRKDPPFAYYKTVVQQIELQDDSLLIAHLPINHVYTYYCNLRDGLNYEPDFYVPEGQTWRLAYGTNADYLKQFFGEYEEEELETLIKQLSPEYTLIREDLWQRYLKYEEDDIVESLMNFFNPHTYRPSFIRKNNE